MSFYHFDSSSQIKCSFIFFYKKYKNEKNYLINNYVINYFYDEWIQKVVIVSNNGLKRNSYLNEKQLTDTNINFTTGITNLRFFVANFIKYDDKFFHFYLYPKRYIKRSLLKFKNKERKSLRLGTNKFTKNNIIFWKYNINNIFNKTTLKWIVKKEFINSKDSLYHLINNIDKNVSIKFQLRSKIWRRIRLTKWKWNRFRYGGYRDKIIFNRKYPWRKCLNFFSVNEGGTTHVVSKNSLRFKFWNTHYRKAIGFKRRDRKVLYKFYAIITRYLNFLKKKKKTEEKLSSNFRAQFLYRCYIKFIYKSFATNILFKVRKYNNYSTRKRKRIYKIVTDRNRWKKRKNPKAKLIRFRKNFPKKLVIWLKRVRPIYVFSRIFRSLGNFIFNKNKIIENWFVKKPELFYFSHLKFILWNAEQFSKVKIVDNIYELRELNSKIFDKLDRFTNVDYYIKSYIIIFSLIQNFDNLFLNKSIKYHQLRYTYITYYINNYIYRKPTSFYIRAWIIYNKINYNFNYKNKKFIFLWPRLRKFNKYLSWRRFQQKGWERLFLRRANPFKKYLLIKNIDKAWTIVKRKKRYIRLLNKKIKRKTKISWKNYLRIIKPNALVRYKKWFEKWSKKRKKDTWYTKRNKCIIRSNKFSILWYKKWCKKSKRYIRRSKRLIIWNEKYYKIKGSISIKKYGSKKKPYKKKKLKDLVMKNKPHKKKLKNQIIKNKPYINQIIKNKPYINQIMKNKPYKKKLKNQIIKKNKQKKIW